MLSTYLALVALLAGGWRHLPPVMGWAFGLFLLVALPSVHTHLPPWDTIQPFFLPHTDWEIFPIRSYDILSTFSLTSMAGLAVLAALTIRTREQLDRFLLALTIGAAYIVYRGLMQRVTGNLSYPDGSPSIQSVFGHPNAFAAYLVAVVPILFMSALSSRSIWQRRFAAAIAVLGVVCLILTFARTPAIAVVVAVVVAAAMAGKIRHVLVVAAVLVSVATAAGAAGPVVDRFSSIAEPPSAGELAPGDSWSWRIVTWGRVLAVTPHWQLTGIGYGHYETRTVEVFGLGGRSARSCRRTGVAASVRTTTSSSSTSRPASRDSRCGRPSSCP